ncbi:MAG TPA: hypothetical protein VLA98_01280 [Solirubrobacteraceae bacterium]|nr:hypothetical protein [Solirubrobacteraceae bacterium]
MADKRIHLPKEGLVDPRQRTPGEQFLDVSDDVQGHGFPLPAPPADFLKRGPGHGGEALPAGDDVEEPEHR